MKGVSFWMCALRAVWSHHHKVDDMLHYDLNSAWSLRWSHAYALTSAHVHVSACFCCLTIHGRGAVTVQCVRVVMSTLTIIMLFTCVSSTGRMFTVYKDAS